MEKLKNQDLLKDKRVIEEIERYKWTESEKAGMDIGFDKAAKEWINQFSDGWVKANIVKSKISDKKIKRF